MSDLGGAQGRQTIIEEDTTFKGSLDSKYAIVVNGKVEGDLTGPSLVVNTGGAVQGGVKAKAIRSAGELQGTFEAEEMQISGRVCDDTTIKAKTLEVRLAKSEESPIVFGECVLEVGEAPDVKAILKSRAAAAAPAPAETPAKAETGAKKPAEKAIKEAVKKKSQSREPAAEKAQEGKPKKSKDKSGKKEPPN